MAAHPQTRPKIESLLWQWEKRWRTRRIILFLPRVLLIAICLGIAGVIATGIVTVLSTLWLAAIIGAGIVAAAVILIVLIGFIGNEDLAAAREFDRRFGLQERLSTALELLDGRITTVPELKQTQIDDAYATALNIDPRKFIKIEIRWIEWFGVITAGILLVVALFLYSLFSAYSEDPGMSEETQVAIADAADVVRDITEEVATNTVLTDTERENLLESLEVSLDELNGEYISPEDAFVQLGELESDLRETAAQISEEAVAVQSALDDAARALQNPAEIPETPTISEDDSSLSDTLESLQDTLSNMSEEERAALAQRLREAAEQLSEDAAPISQDMAELAEALESGDFQELQEFLDQTLGDIETLESQQLERVEVGSQLESTADEVQQASEEIAESEAQEGQEGEQGEQGGEQGEAAPGGQSPSESDQDGQNSSETGSPVISENTDGQPVLTQGDQASDQGQQLRSDSDVSGTGDGSGSGETNQRQDGMSSGTQPDNSGTQSNDGRETQFQSLFVGNSINVDGSSNIFLAADAADALAAEGDFQENQAGEATVPYNQVFRNYEDAANHALENDYVPLGMRDVVRNYFNALAPTSTGQ